MSDHNPELVVEFLSELDGILSDHERNYSVAKRTSRWINRVLSQATAKNATRRKMVSAIAEMLGFCGALLARPVPSINKQQIEKLAASQEIKRLRAQVNVLATSIAGLEWSKAFDLCARLVREGDIHVDEALPEQPKAPVTKPEGDSREHITMRACECGRQTTLTKCVVCQRRDASDAMMDVSKPSADHVRDAIIEIGKHGITATAGSIDPKSASLLLATLLEDLQDLHSWEWAMHRVKFHEKLVFNVEDAGPEYESARRVADELVERLPAAIKTLHEPRIRAVRPDGSAPTPLNPDVARRSRKKKV